MKLYNKIAKVLFSPIVIVGVILIFIYMLITLELFIIYEPDEFEDANETYRLSAWDD